MTSTSTKTCNKCQVTKPFDEYYRYSDGRLRARCKACYKEYNQAQYKRHHSKRLEYDANRPSGWVRRPEDVERYMPDDARRHDSYLQRTYGITREDYIEMLANQDGGCAICGNPPDEGKNLHVDHNHDTDEVCALLCPRCNTSLGRFNDDPTLVLAAARYLHLTRFGEILT